MTAWVHRTLIVPDRQVKFARLLAESLAGPSGSGMWSTPLSATGALPPTHWISSGLLREDFVALLTQPAACTELAQSLGFKVSEKALTKLLEDSDITEDTALGALSRLGLTLVTEESNDG